jgi:hypothetical protein
VLEAIQSETDDAESAQSRERTSKSEQTGVEDEVGRRVDQSGLGRAGRDGVDEE